MTVGVTSCGKGELGRLAAESEAARRAFNAAWHDEAITEPAYNEIRKRYTDAMNAHHAALGFV